MNVAMKSIFRRPFEYELPYPIPYAVGPSAQGDGWISFTYRGSASIRFALGCSIALAVLFLTLGAFIIINEGLWHTLYFKGIPIPIWVLEAAILIMGMFLTWLFFRFRRREEVLISVSDQLVQYVKERDKPGAFSPGCILVVSSHTFEPKGWSSKLLMPERSITLVVIAGGERYGIVGAFREEQSAAKYADMVSKVTRLHIRTHTPEDLRMVQGHLKLRGTDEQALLVLVSELPLRR